MLHHVTIIAKFMDLNNRDGYFHGRTMEEKYGLLFGSRVQSCTGKSYMSISFVFICHIRRTKNLFPRQRDVTTSPFYGTF